jgi:formate-dependent nitrite reductase membrane component NrfD
VAALLALAGLGGLLYYGYTQEVGHAAVRLLLDPKILGALAGGVVLLGLLIPAVAAWRATDKYLHMKADDLYLL